MFLSIVLCLAASCVSPKGKRTGPLSLKDYSLGFDSRLDARLQTSLEKIDSTLRQRFGMGPDQACAGLLDLRTLRLAMIRPDSIQYAASIPKIGILLAWMDLHPEAAASLTPDARRELGLMIKASSNEMAAKYSREIGLKETQAILDTYGFYDASRGGGIWVGKHYGEGSERRYDPVGGHSHAATVRQLLRFFLLLEQGKLVSPAASKTMREIFLSPDIPHDQIKFVKGLAGRNLEILRKWGSWQEWLHDAAVIKGPGRHYILVGLTRHPNGDAYLEELAKAVDDLLRT